MYTPQTLLDLVEILRRLDGAGFSGRVLEIPNRLDVSGVGRLFFPLNKTQAAKLHAAGDPALYGQGTETLLDTSVRDTSEIPADRVKLGEDWQKTLQSVSRTLAATLGLPSDCELEAELHSMLVYGPGQFFLPHKDSEKVDGMVATLVATLPSKFKGGELVVEHQGQRRVYAGDPRRVEWVAFYADCLHALQPVESGYRVALTFNLVLKPGQAWDGEPTAVDEALPQALAAYFSTPRPVSRWREERGDPPDPPPDRFVFLLDHEYTEAGLRWQQLKGIDRTRVQELRSAAEAVDCNVALAQVTVHESWHCMEPYEPYGYGRSRYRSWHSGEDGWEEEAATRTDPDDYELVDLIDSETALTRLRSKDGDTLETVEIPLDSGNIALLSPTSELKPYASEYEGYTGNAGNTMDRWYRRAALVVWPRALDFAISLEMAPSTNLARLAAQARRGETCDPMVKSFLPLWSNVVASLDINASMDDILAISNAVEEAEIGLALLRPLCIEVLEPRHAEAWILLQGRWGIDAIWHLLDDWGQTPSYASVKRKLPSTLNWIAGLASLCRALIEVEGVDGITPARLLLNDRWTFWSRELEDALGQDHPEERSKSLLELREPLLGLLESSALVHDDALQDEILSTLSTLSTRNKLLPLSIAVLKSARGRRSADIFGLQELQTQTVAQLEQRLAEPARAPDDWSVSLENSCGCELCTTLRDFLEAADRRVLRWPIAKAKRQHIHRILDHFGAPVRHETHRSGSPYVLVLTKSGNLHQEEARQRKLWTAELGALESISFDG